MSGRARLFLIGSGTFLGAVAIFAAGVLVATATNGSDTGSNDLLQALSADGNSVGGEQPAGGSAPGSAGAVPDSGGGLTSVPAPGVAARPTFGGGRDEAGVATEPGLPFGGCPGTLDGLLDGKVLDLESGLFQFRALGDAFDPSSISLSASQGCPGEDVEAGTVVVANSAWVHEDSGIYIWISQQQQPERTANVDHGRSLDFWDGGYRFSLSVGEPYFLGPDGGPPADDVGDADAVLAEALAQLAPNLEWSCFYRQMEGGWDDLDLMGIGDPRPAVPDGYREASVTVSLFAPPPASCGEPPFAGSTYFHAEFLAASDGFLGIDAYTSEEGGSPRFGELYDNGANWSNGKLWFSIWEKSETSGDRDVIARIAEALDPSFSPLCFQETHSLAESDLEDLGFHVPSASGFKIARADLLVTEVGPQCEDPNPASLARFNLNWVLKGDSGAIIEAFVGRDPGMVGEAYGSRWEFELNWGDGQGTNYSVSGRPGSDGIAGLPDALEAVALTLDPALDIDSLIDEVPEPEGFPVPAPR